jgi:hypothetical protein
MHSGGESSRKERSGRLESISSFSNEGRLVGHPPDEILRTIKRCAWITLENNDENKGIVNAVCEKMNEELELRGYPERYKRDDVGNFALTKKDGQYDLLELSGRTNAPRYGGTIKCPIDEPSELRRELAAAAEPIDQIDSYYIEPDGDHVNDHTRDIEPHYIIRPRCTYDTPFPALYTRWYFDRDVPLAEHREEINRQYHLAEHREEFKRQFHDAGELEMDRSSWQEGIGSLSISNQGNTDELTVTPKDPDHPILKAIRRSAGITLKNTPEISDIVKAYCEMVPRPKFEELTRITITRGDGDYGLYGRGRGVYGKHIRIPNDMSQLSEMLTAASEPIDQINHFKIRRAGTDDIFYSRDNPEPNYIITPQSLRMKRGWNTQQTNRHSSDWQSPLQAHMGAFDSLFPERKGHASPELEDVSRSVESAAMVDGAQSDTSEQTKNEKAHSEIVHALQRSVAIIVENNGENDDIIEAYCNTANQEMGQKRGHVGISFQDVRGVLLVRGPSDGYKTTVVKLPQAA